MDQATRVQTLIHIGARNFLAISGGRWETVDADTISLPVHYGYSVEIKLNRGQDLYEVRRIFRRGAKRWVKGEQLSVYCDEVGEVAYRASCYLDEFGGES
jgi:hypothetical protein